MNTPRLWSAAAALVLLVVAFAATTMHARGVETRYVHTLAPQMFPQKTLGIALQRAAFRQPDLLPLYGSSDVNVPNAHHASALFREYPTGFTVFPVGSIGSSSLNWVQALAAVGPDLYGKKVAVSVPVKAFMDEAVDRHAYAANFSPLHASALAFSTRLSFALKQRAARRMLQFPATVANDALLRFALERLADGSWGSRTLYYASLPLGTLHNAVLRLRDHWETLGFLRAQRGLRTVLPQPAPLDWTELMRRAVQEARGKATHNVFGFGDDFWAAHAPEIVRQKGMYASQATQPDVERGAEWTDFDLLLQVVRALGGEPLILSIPLNGAYYDYLGVPAATRHAYYERLRQLAKAHEVQVVDYAEYDSDKYFSVDAGMHLSAEGWVYYDYALDAFFHDRTLAGSE